MLMEGAVLGLRHLKHLSPALPFIDPVTPSKLPLPRAYLLPQIGVAMKSPFLNGVEAIHECL